MLEHKSELHYTSCRLNFASVEEKCILKIESYLFFNNDKLLRADQDATSTNFHQKVMREIENINGLTVRSVTSKCSISIHIYIA